MGTRGVFGFRIKNKDKLSYCHYDSYPESLGKSIVDFCRKQSLLDNNLKELKEKAKKIKLVSEEKSPTEKEKKHFFEYFNEKEDYKINNWYSLFRNIQDNIEKITDYGIMLNSNEFILNSLFCEWGYIINLDSNKLEIYKGIQNKNHSLGRYSQNAKNKNGFFPCALIKEYPLNEIPDNWINEICEENTDMQSLKE